MSDTISLMLILRMCEVDLHVFKLMFHAVIMFLQAVVYILIHKSNLYCDSLVSSATIYTCHDTTCHAPSFYLGHLSDFLRAIKESGNDELPLPIMLRKW